LIIAKSPIQWQKKVKKDKQVKKKIENKSDLDEVENTMEDALTEVSNTTTELIKTEIKSKKVVVKTENHGGICSFCAYKTSHSGQLRKHQKNTLVKDQKFVHFAAKDFHKRKHLRRMRGYTLGKSLTSASFVMLAFAKDLGLILMSNLSIRMKLIVVVANFMNILGQKNSKYLQFAKHILPY